ncbi:MAG: gamma-glutamyltransferase, partial [Deltaproteobacteria bacterium]|nr:gamma-glutamyltransferase [Deltaproteobacteria bacterium]
AAKRVFLQGGNAIDAGIAAALTLAVVEPYNSGLGGGGMALLWDGQKKKAHAIDFREKAPLKAQSDLYLKEGIDPKASTQGPLAIAMPGEVAGLAYLHQKWGKLPWKELFKEAIHYAETGFIPDQVFMDRVENRRDCLIRDYHTYQIFRPLLQTKSDISLNGDPNAPKNSINLPKVEKVPLWTQKDLANTLKTLRDYGAESFYQGTLGGLWLGGLKDKGAILESEDLSSYQVLERKALKSRFEWGQVWGMPLPSSGGTSLIRALNTLESLQLSPSTEAKRLDQFIQVLGRIFKDRNESMGDDDFVKKIPIKKWIRKSFAKKEAQAIIQNSDLSSQKRLKENQFKEAGTGHTSHLSVLDQEGNALSLTLSLNLSFGSCVTAGKSGVLMNNQMDDFSTHPGQANAFGLVQSTANAIAPGKRPLSSITPTIITQDKVPILALGSPGGPRIITSVLQVLYRHYFLKQDLKSAIASPRLHYQDKPKVVFLEKNIPQDLENFLKDLGYLTKREETWSNVQAVTYDPQQKSFRSFSDPRGIGQALVVQAKAKDE